MRARFVGVAAALMAGACLTSAPARSDTIIPVTVDLGQLVPGSTPDQSQTGLTHITGFGSDNPVVTTLAQTFTVGIAGELGTIGIWLGCNCPSINMNILQTSGGVPTATILATAAAGIPGWPTPVSSYQILTYFNFSSFHILVAVGQVLAFQPHVVAPTGAALGINIAYGLSDPYSRGELYVIHPEIGINDWQPFTSELVGQGPIGGVDAAFVVSVSPVPIPAALPLFATGLGVLGLLTCRRKRRGAAVAA